MAERVRLDIALEQRGLVQSRARARDAVLRGTVRVNGVPALKPAAMVGAGDIVAIDDPANGYVSRAALKLLAGLDAGAIDVRGRLCLDLGASTGGFTQVLVERGAAKVYAVDVGHEQLHPIVRALPQVVALEGVNVKDLTPAQIPEPVEVVVCDISFVSIAKVLAPPLALCRPGADAVLLIKPQFEVGREHVGKGGIVSDGAAIADAEAGIVRFMAAEGWTHRASLPSPIAGGDGNKEIVALFTRTL
ncbi:MAG: TlyA family rRNA (cytidine-2'-O)-methyltransferase [Devosia sp. 67-54]|uniref:TlyA family RNA methyltransferase n=1 Tax=unclassified Devosia TaxID=196773 RepID=UPI00095A382B|nr:MULTISPECIES: TlyA family RNA methyltransferase [unclassified Devosia]MBN9305427.1 TlyA family RNA methyltransferase [Devosia sp.]OJX19016.1 MAG: TlyA family rRNA (cytidine-2'-O)-methyltransferase [Devosia sp. 67-54]